MIPCSMTITPFGRARLPSLLKQASLLPNLNFTIWAVNHQRQEPDFEEVPAKEVLAKKEVKDG